MFLFHVAVADGARAARAVHEVRARRLSAAGAVLRSRRSAARRPHAGRRRCHDQNDVVELRRLVDETCAFLTELLLPHMEASERAIYPHLERLPPSMTPMRREHDLFVPRRRAADRPASPRAEKLGTGEGIRLRRTRRLLKVHLARSCQQRRRAARPRRGAAIGWSTCREPTRWPRLEIASQTAGSIAAGRRLAAGGAGWSPSCSSCWPAAARTATRSSPSSRRCRITGGSGRRWPGVPDPARAGGGRPRHLGVVERSHRAAAARVPADRERLCRAGRVGGSDEGAHTADRRVRGRYLEFVTAERR